MLPMRSLYHKLPYQNRSRCSPMLPLTLIMTPKDHWVKVHGLTSNRIGTYVATPDIAMKRNRSQSATMRVERPKQWRNDFLFETKHQLLNLFARALRC